VDRQAAADELKQRWTRALALLQARGAAMAELQARADAYAQALARATELTGEAWAALPVLPAYRPATYGRDLNLRANLYLYGATDGKSGGGAVSAYVARQRPDLRALDAGAREILLMPMHAAEQGSEAGATQSIASPAAPAAALPGKAAHATAPDVAAGNAGAPPAAAPHISPDPTRQEAA